MEDGLDENDRVGLLFAHEIEQRFVLGRPVRGGVSADLVDAEKDIDLAELPRAERLGERDLFAVQLDEVLFHGVLYRQTVLGEVGRVAQPRVVVEAVGVRVAEKERVVKIARVHRGKLADRLLRLVGDHRIDHLGRLGQEIGHGAWDRLGHAGDRPRKDAALGGIKKGGDGGRILAQRVEILLVSAGGVERGEGIERCGAHRAQPQQGRKVGHGKTSFRKIQKRA